MAQSTPNYRVYQVELHEEYDMKSSEALNTIKILEYIIHPRG